MGQYAQTRYRTKLQGALSAAVFPHIARSIAGFMPSALAPEPVFVTQIGHGEWSERQAAHSILTLNGSLKHTSETINPGTFQGEPDQSDKSLFSSTFSLQKLSHQKAIEKELCWNTQA
eukprot:19035-Amphidinium_carterae.1